MNMNSLTKKNNTIPNAITITRSNSKISANGKKSTKGITLNKTSTRLTRTSTPSEMTAK